jgi:MFS family permease
MDRSRTVVTFVNAAHFLDHYAMLVFAAAIIVMAPAFRTDYSALLAYATPAFVAFGAGSLLTGWLGDRWCRRHMMVIFFVGIGAAMIAVGLARSPLQLGAALIAVGLLASIYHPVGTAMLVAHARSVGRDLGINGVWGNLGVAASALVTGAICEYLGWRWAFFVPGLVAIVLGVLFAVLVRGDARPAQKAAGATARVSKGDMRLVVIALALTIIASSTTFNAVTVALPKLLAERLAVLSQSPAQVGLWAAGAYLFGALTQYTIGQLLDRHSLKRVFVPLSVLLAPLLFFGAGLTGVPLLLVCIGVVMGIFGQVTINDTIIGKYTSDEWRSRAYALRYFLGFTAAGASVGLVAWIHDRGGFTLLLQALGVLSVLVILGAMIFPRDSGPRAAEAVGSKTVAGPAGD